MRIGQVLFPTVSCATALLALMGCGQRGFNQDGIQLSQSSQAGDSAVAVANGSLSLSLPELTGGDGTAIPTGREAQKVTVSLSHKVNKAWNVEETFPYKAGVEMLFARVPVGEYSVRVRVLDGKGEVLSGTGSASVETGQVATATIRLGASTGALVIQVLPPENLPVCRSASSGVAALCEADATWTCSLEVGEVWNVAFPIFASSGQSAPEGSSKKRESSMDLSSPIYTGNGCTKAAALAKVTAELCQQKAFAFTAEHEKRVRCERKPAAAVTPKDIDPIVKPTISTPTPILPVPTPTPTASKAPASGASTFLLKSACELAERNICTKQYEPSECETAIPDAANPALKVIRSGGGNICEARVSLLNKVCEATRGRFDSAPELRATIVCSVSKQ